MAEEPDMETLSASVAKRLRDTPWDQMESPNAKVREEVHHRVALIREDLAKIHEADPNRALRLWDENVPDAKEREAAQPEPDAPNSIAPGRRRKRKDSPEVFAPEVRAHEPAEAERPKTAEKAGLPALVPQPAPDPEPNAADKGEGPPAAAEAPRADTGLDLKDQRRRMLLETLDKRFLVAGNVYHEREGDHAVAFEAQDKRLITRRDDAVVITAMLDLAEARGWEDIRLTGTRAFKKEAWFQANLRGIETSGHRPDALDRSRLADALKDWQAEAAPSVRVNVMAKDEGRAAPERVATATPSVPPTNEPKVDLSAAQKQAVSLLEKLMRERGDGADAIARATEVATERLRSTRIHVGKLISTGTAPYQDKADEKDSPYVVLEDETGKTSKVWGVDLPRALQESRANLGEDVVLAFKGRERVEVDVAIRDASGTVTHTEKQEVDRNTWEVRRFEDLREAAQNLAKEAAKAVHQPAKLRVFDKTVPSAAPPPQVKVERPRAQERYL